MKKRNPYLGSTEKQLRVDFNNNKRLIVIREYHLNWVWEQLMNSYQDNILITQALAALIKKKRKK